MLKKIEKIEKILDILEIEKDRRDNEGILNIGCISERGDLCRWTPGAPTRDRTTPGTKVLVPHS